MRWVAGAVAGLVIGYLLGAAAGAAVLAAISKNTHDKAQEMAMTAAFVTGPAGALLGVITGLARARRAKAALRRLQPADPTTAGDDQ